MSKTNEIGTFKVVFELVQHSLYIHTPRKTMSILSPYYQTLVNFVVSFQ